ncbi:tetraspanin-8-like [Cucumis melo var. makuwa]|uniref:Tetraspanin-8-like n=1 Tax=Cucumis melo var. makuwa TaxID=1194695 RepID=A0A5D3E6F7_CUCMM|nr:tetraspanin-8-like [Cucumis melo var. makuwa]
MFILILLLFVFTISAFTVTNKAAGKVLSNKGYKEYRLGDYSNWLQNRVRNNKDWNRIKNCRRQDECNFTYKAPTQWEKPANVSSFSNPDCGTGLAEKAMVVLSSLARIQEGKNAIVEEGGIVALVEAIEDGSVKGKEFAMLTLLQLCVER